MAITVADLPSLIGTLGPRPLLYCSECGAEYSAERGDYFALSPDYVFMCCGGFMELVYKQVRYEPAER